MTNDDMLAGAGVEPNAPKYSACYIPYSAKFKKAFGEVHFSSDCISPSVVAHEMLHAIFDLAFKLSIPIHPPNPHQSYRCARAQDCEALCQELEKLISDFWIKYYSTG